MLFRSAVALAYYPLAADQLVTDNAIPAALIVLMTILAMLGIIANVAMA